MTLEKQLIAWDGKSTDVISAIYASQIDNDTFISEVITLIEHSCYEKGATWLLKHHLESGGTLQIVDINSLYQGFADLQGWEARLHALQSMPYMPITKPMKTIVEMFVRHGLTDSNKFVRAWAYNGFYELALQYPEYQAEALQFFNMALKDEAASVKARVRNIMKKGFS